MNSYNELVDKIMTGFSSGEYSKDVALAKDEFHKSVGVFDEEAHDLETRISLFIDWYLFIRPLPQFDSSPINALIENNLVELSQEEKEILSILNSSRYSLFEFVKIKGSDVYIKDLFSGYKLTLKDSAVNLGFSKDEYFSTRLFPQDDNFVFGSAFCIHPPQASKYILAEVKKVKKVGEGERDAARTGLILKLIRMRHKVDQYKHVNLKQIYSNESKLGL